MANTLLLRFVKENRTRRTLLPRTRGHPFRLDLHRGQWPQVGPAISWPSLRRYALPALVRKNKAWPPRNTNVATKAKAPAIRTSSQPERPSAKHAEEQCTATEEHHRRDPPHARGEEDLLRRIHRKNQLSMLS